MNQEQEYKKLKSELEAKKIEKATLEAQITASKEQQDKILQTLKDKGFNTIEEAQQYIATTEATITSELTRLRDVLDGKVQPVAQTISTTPSTVSTPIVETVSAPMVETIPNPLDGSTITVASTGGEPVVLEAAPVDPSQPINIYGSSMSVKTPVVPGQEIPMSVDGSQNPLDVGQSVAPLTVEQPVVKDTKPEVKDIFTADINDIFS